MGELSINSCPHIPGAPVPHTCTSTGQQLPTGNTQLPPHTPRPPLITSAPSSVPAASPSSHIPYLPSPSPLPLLRIPVCESRSSVARSIRLVLHPALRNCHRVPAEIDIGLLTLWNSICKLNDSSKLVTFAVGLSLACCQEALYLDIDGLGNWQWRIYSLALFTLS